MNDTRQLEEPVSRHGGKAEGDNKHDASVGTASNAPDHSPIISDNTPLTPLPRPGPLCPLHKRTAAFPTGTFPRLVTFFSNFSERRRVARLVACGCKVGRGWSSRVMSIVARRV